MNQLNGFFNNLFGTIAGSAGGLSRIPGNVGFIPSDGKGGTIRLRGENAVWLGLRIPIQQLYAYDFCYPLSSVVDRLADSDITGTLEILRSSGKGKENYATNDWAQRMNKLLARPNPMQSWEQFRGQQVVYKKVFGFCPVFPVVPAGFTPEYATSLVNLPPWLFEAVPTNRLLYEKSIDGIVKEYRCSIMGQSFNLKPSEVMILEDSFFQDYQRNFLLPQSRLVGLDMAVSNICAAMEADNVLLRKKGPLGFISNDPIPDPVAGTLPMKKEDKDALQDDLAKYGMGWDQYQFVISKNPARWNPMSYDVKQLGTKDTVLAGAKAICQRYGFPYVLFEDSDATYSNQESAHKKFYDNNVIPNNKRDLAKYNQFFGAAENQCKIVCDYSHLAIFKEDELNSGRARAYNDQGLQIEYLNDIITKNQWLTELDLDTIGPEGDLLYSQSAAKKAADEMAKQQADAKNNIDALDKQNGNQQ